MRTVFVTASWTKLRHLLIATEYKHLDDLASGFAVVGFISNLTSYFSKVYIAMFCCGLVLPVISTSFHWHWDNRNLNLVPVMLPWNICLAISYINEDIFMCAIAIILLTMNMLSSMKNNLLLEIDGKQYFRLCVFRTLYVVDCGGLRFSHHSFPKCHRHTSKTSPTVRWCFWLFFSFGIYKCQ